MRVVAALSRHGSYEQPESVPGGVLMYPLTSEGRAQARQLAHELCRLAQRHHLVVHPVIDASPLPRDHETACIAAEILTSVTNKPFRVEQHSVLCERSLRATSDRTLAERDQAETPAATPDPLRGRAWGRPESAPVIELPFPAPESVAMAGKRVAEHLRKTALTLASKSRAETLKLFVGHGGAFCYAAFELGVIDLPVASNLSMPAGRPVLIERLATGSWAHLDGAWKDKSRAPDEASAS